MNIDFFKDLLDQGIVTIRNKTRNYLIPCITDYGKSFNKLLDGFSHIASTIDDTNSPFERYQVGLVINVARSDLLSFTERMISLRKHPAYVRDYLYGEILYDKLHVIVIQIPEQYHVSYDHFVNGKYSQMYSLQEISRLFDPEKMKSETMRNFRLFLQLNLIRHPDAKERFEHILNKGYEDTSASPIILEDESELDYLPKAVEEILYPSMQTEALDEKLELSHYFERKIQFN